MMKSFLLLLSIFFTIQITTAQENKLELSNKKETTTWGLAKNDARLMWGGFKHVYTRPLEWDQDDFAVLGGVIVGTAGLNILDERANRYFDDQSEDIPSIIKDFGWYFGSPQNNYGVNSAIYLAGLFTKNKKLRKTGILMITSASAAGLIQTVSKTVAGRARPNAGGSLSFKPFSSEGGYHSFPSGHTILSFTTFYALSKQFDNIWVKGALIGAGMVSPVSRLWSEAHWLTDVALSTALTVFVVDAVDNYLDKAMNEDLTQAEKKQSRVSWQLRFGGTQIGVVGTF
ncbi:PAP2 superfamily protein [Mesonia algae]|uniref:PAP2 superfamily protein n=1 Tax=Mesonia algae TaxID=213248 RepID=A0A2W7I3G3_9FLAO|nr:phosphatase PAP2 family protein [Mesonia algae]PZW40739.1 PAP2 superfamily protein [Mesonia algae]